MKGDEECHGVTYCSMGSRGRNLQPEYPREGPAQLPGPGPAHQAAESRDLVPLTPGELRQVKAVLTAPLHQQVVEAREQRMVLSPYPRRETFRAAASALRNRL